MSRRFHETKAEGDLTEQLLDSFLISQHGPLTKMKDCFVVDREGDSCWVEIKGRSLQYRSDDKYSEQGWYIGQPKINFAKASTKPVYFYYYFHSDKTLWRLQYSDAVFDTLVPKKNRQGQLTYTVPKRFWTCVEFQN